MATPGKVQKIYDLRTLGFDIVDKQLKQVSKDFDDIKKAKRSAEGKILSTNDATEIKKFSDEIARLKIREQELRVERQQMLNEQKAANIARQEDIRLQKAKIQGNLTEEGSIIRIRQQIRELNALLITKNQKGTALINFQGESLSIDQAVAKLKQLTAAEQEFRRQFARDQTLVGEYTSGIVAAFKQMGLDELVGGQINRTKERLNSLNTDFDRLQKELAETKAAGKSTETIELQMIENRNEVIKLDTELVRLRTDLRGTGDVGNQVSTAIGKGFQQLKGQVAGFALGFIGISAIFSRITSFASGSIAEFEEAETSVARFSATLKNAGRENEFQELSAEVENLAERFKFLDNDAIRNATEQLIVYGKVGKEQIKQLLPVIIDFATRQRISVEESTRTIIKGLEGNARAFKEYGLNLKEGGDESERFGIIVNDLGNRIRGTAENFQKLNSGELAINKQQFKEIQEELGKRLIPALTTLGTIILFLITNLPTIATLVGILAAGWAVANIQLALTNAQLVLYNLLIVRNYVLLGILSAVQLVYNSALIVFNGVLKVVTAGLRLFGLTATAATGPLGVILTILALLGTAAIGLSKALGASATAIDKNTQKTRLLSDIQREAAAATTEQRIKAEQLVKVVNDLTLSEETRNKALKDLIAIDPIFQKSLVDGKINYDKLNQSLLEYNANLLETARLQAAQARAQRENQELQNLINIRTTFEERKTGLRVKDFRDLSEEEVQFLPQGIGSTRSVRGTAALLGIDISQKEINTAIANINRAINAQKTLAEVSNETATTLLAKSFKTGETTTQPSVFERFQTLLKQGGTQKQFDDLKDEIDKKKKELNIFSQEFKDLDNLEKQIESIINPKQKTTVGGGRGSRLTGEQKDAFKDIDALRDKELADEKIRLQTREINEETFLKNSLAINQQAISDKLKLLKGASAEERKQIAELNLEKVTQEQETNNKIFDLLKTLLKDELDAEIANIKLRSAAVENDPTLTATDKAQAKLDADNAVLALQEEFNARIDFLEKRLAQQSLTNTKESAEEISKTKEQILADQKAISEAALTDIAEDGEKQRAKIITTYEKLRQAILNNDKLTATQRERALDKLAKIHNKTIISSELKQLTKEFKEIKEQYEAGLKSEADFLQKKKELEEKRTQLKVATTALVAVDIALPSGAQTQKLLSERLSKAFGFDEQSLEAKALGEVISQTFDLAADAMNAYFDAEQERINQSLQLQLDRLAMEEEQVKSRAQSQEEIESIEKEFESRKRKAQREAGEQLKKSRRAEAKISLAVELANIAVQASQYPFPASLVIGAVLSGLAFGRYALRVAEINREQFEFGGQPEEKKTRAGRAIQKVKKAFTRIATGKQDEVPERGGKFGGRPHSRGGTPFKFKGRQYEAEVDELAVIRTKSAPKAKKFTVTGNQMQIASFANKIGGGIDFKPGAKVTKFAGGGFLGDVLQAPVLQNGSSSVVNNFSGVDEEKFDELIDVVREHQRATDERIDRIEVVQKTSTVTEAQKKEVRQSSIGTL